MSRSRVRLTGGAAALWGEKHAIIVAALVALALGILAMLVRRFRLRLTLERK